MICSTEMIKPRVCWLNVLKVVGLVSEIKLESRELGVPEEEVMGGLESEVGVTDGEEETLLEVSKGRAMEIPLASYLWPKMPPTDPS